MLVSIIVPVYNAQDYLEGCIASLIGQTYQNIEILLINDGSTDNSPLLCDRFADEDNRIRVFHKENGGTHTARNLGIQQAKGDYVMFIDPDDWVDTNTVEKLVSEIEKHNLDVVRFNYVKEFGEHSVAKSNTFVSEEVCWGENCRNVCRQTIGLIKDELKHPENLNFLASVCFATYKKSIIIESDIKFVNIREIATFSDGLFNIAFLMRANSFKFIDKCFYHYRKCNAASATSNYRPDFLKRQMIMFGYMEQMVKEIDRKECYEAFNNRIALSTMEMCINALLSDKGFVNKYKEIKFILNNSAHKNAYKQFALKHFSLKWRIYYFFVKYRMTIFVYAMSYAIRKIQKRG
ncbi:MAG: glycosyltransferase [Clostridia bacterium]|nr:glycosyltransferase [Clostridia bacterium]